MAIVGYPGAAADDSGHDLTYQAAAGLLDPPHLPRALVADFAGADAAVHMALALLLARERGHGPGTAEVALSAAGADYAAALHYGLTAPDGLLGGGFAGYGLYATQDGWIAVAALEPRYRAALAAALGAPITRDALTAHFAAAPTAHWVAWAAAHDVPLVPLADPGTAALRRLPWANRSFWRRCARPSPGTGAAPTPRRTPWRCWRTRCRGCWRAPACPPIRSRTSWRAATRRPASRRPTSRGRPCCSRAGR